MSCKLFHKIHLLPSYHILCCHVCSAFVDYVFYCPHNLLRAFIYILRIELFYFPRSTVRSVLYVRSNNNGSHSLVCRICTSFKEYLYYPSSTPLWLAKYFSFYKTLWGLARTFFQTTRFLLPFYHTSAFHVCMFSFSRNVSFIFSTPHSSLSYTLCSTKHVILIPTPHLVFHRKVSCWRHATLWPVMCGL